MQHDDEKALTRPAVTAVLVTGLYILAILFSLLFVMLNDSKPFWLLFVIVIGDIIARRTNRFAASGVLNTEDRFSTTSLDVITMVILAIMFFAEHFWARGITWFVFVLAIAGYFYCSNLNNRADRVAGPERNEVK